MRPKAIFYFIFVLLAAGLMACGGDSGDDTEAPDEQTQPTETTPSEPTQPDVAAGRDIDFAAEEQAIRDLYAEYAVAHGDQDVDVLSDVWVRSEGKDVFTAWTFWAGTFEKNEGAKAVSKAWAGIFRLRGGKMEVDITYISIDSRGKEAVLRGAYNWGNQKGDLISVLKKDGSDWKIRAIDYTDGRFGKQVKDLIEPAHTVGEIPEE
jgi:ketosteroid isomerase-like protein